MNAVDATHVAQGMTQWVATELAKEDDIVDIVHVVPIGEALYPLFNFNNLNALWQLATWCIIYVEVCEEQMSHRRRRT